MIENSVMRDYASNMSATSILSDFLYEVALVSDIDNLNSTDDKLTLMSLHASKGLEYENIYLTGLNEGVFPSYQAITSDDRSEIEEERRLCYVGITRAKKNLHLTAARRRMQNGNYSNYQISRFVEEIDGDLLDKNMLSIAPYIDLDGSDNIGEKLWGYGYRSKRWEE